MAKLSANTVLVDPSTGVAVSLNAGDDVPDWATDLVGDHLLDKPKPAAKSDKPAAK